jgi:hypothetical protein
MNHLLKFLLLPLMIMAIYAAKSQNLSLGATGCMGLSKATSGEPQSYVTQTRFALSGNLGLYMEQRLSDKSALGMEATWVQMGSRYVSKDQTVRNFSGGIVGTVSSRYNLYSGYLGLPVYYRFQMGKFGFKGGVQTLIFLFARSTYHVEGVLNNESFNDDGPAEAVKFESIDFGPRIGADYQLGNRCRIRADYYHGLSNMNTYKTSAPLRNRQISIGISCRFGG